MQSIYPVRNNTPPFYGAGDHLSQFTRESSNTAGISNGINLSPNGFLLIDKPLDLTSHDVVAKVRRLMPPQTKVGHAGTLDPKATGLLILGLGRATKLLGEFSRLNKSYDCVVKLGATSLTDDNEGPITPQVVDKIPDIFAVRAVLKTFIGQITQTPPIYSAKKQRGVRLYRLARRGQKVTPKPQTINIYKIDLSRYEYPELALTISCSSGTYIRAIARDIGTALKTGGYLMSLRRTSIGPFSVTKAVAMDGLSFEKINDALISPAATVAQIKLTAEATAPLPR